MSVVIWCTTTWGLSSHLSLIFLFPWKVSVFTRMRSPGFKPMAPIFQSYYCFCPWAYAVDWASASWRVALKWSLTVVTSHQHARWRCLAWAPLHSLRWGNKNWLEALPCTQTSNSVGCTQSLQTWWHYRHALFPPDDLASQLFHLLLTSQSSAWSFDGTSLPACLGVIGHDLQLLHTEEFTHLPNNVAHEVHTMIN